MPIDFNKLIDRTNSDSEKWKIKPNELPMWVADMDFETAPPIKEAVKNIADFGIFGYCGVSNQWNEAIANWWQTRHHFQMNPDALIYTSGVIPAISSIVRKMTTVAENVLVMTPVYNIFFNCILNNGRNVVENELIYQDGEYSIDFKLLEKQLSDPQTTMMILCNPHNPIGKIWDADTLAKIGALCHQYQVIVVSDEIHCDLCDPGYEYIPFAAVNETCANISITCIAPSKAFNIAALHTAAVYVANPYLYHKVNRGLNTDDIAEPNAFAAAAAIAAYTSGAAWLDELRNYILENKMLVSTYLKANIPQIKLVEGHATYLIWLDCSSFCDDSKAFSAFIRQETGLWLSSGHVYRGNGNCFLRMNIAAPKERVIDGLNRLKEAVNRYQ